MNCQRYPLGSVSILFLLYVFSIYLCFLLIFRVFEQEQVLKKDSRRTNFLMLQDVLEKLKQQRVDKENKLADNSLSFPELRDKLLNRVKSVKSTI